MGMVAPFQGIASAYFVFLGRWGDVTRQAERWGVSRQAVYRQSQETLRAVDGEDHRVKLAELRRRVEELQRENDELRAERDKRVPLTVTIDPDKQAEFVCVGQANGVSLPVAQSLLEVLLRKETPSVAKLGRFTLAAGQKAKETLAVLDELSRPLARQGVLDEIFTGKQPVLMAVEPDSLCWLNGRLAPSREGEEWLKDLRPLSNLEQATSDLGSGLQNGLKKLNAERVAAGQKEVASQVDHFHLLREGRSALRLQQSEVSNAMKKAEAAERKAANLRRHGQNACGYARAAQNYWRQAEQAMDRWSACERLWQRLREGLNLFLPTGELNSRARVEALIGEILPQLEDKRWAKVRRWLKRREICTFLDRVHQQLDELPIEAEVRQTVVEAEGISRRPELTEGEGSPAAAQRGVVLVAGVLLGLLGTAGKQARDMVRGVLRNTWRASSLVEGLNSVLRMQQARHRKLSQEMLDLKRLYWNCRPLRTGRRRKQMPYQRLGLKLPNLRWWELLKLSPEHLRSQLSAVPIAA
jgi:hypothetical protein